MREWIRRLPVIAAVALAVAIASFFVVEGKLRKSRVESSETQRTVDAAVVELQSLHPGSLEDPSFRQALERFSRSRYVYAVWLIRLDGRIAFSTAGFAATGSVQDLALD